MGSFISSFTSSEIDYKMLFKTQMDSFTFSALMILVRSHVALLFHRAVTVDPFHRGFLRSQRLEADSYACGEYSQSENKQL